MASLNANIVVLAGRIGNSKVDTLPSGKLLGRARLAVNQSWKVGNEWKQKTSWIPLTAFYPNIYEKFHENALKGALVYVEGRIQADSAKQQDGTYKEFWSVVVNRFNVIGVDKAAPAAEYSGATGSFEGEVEREAGEDDIPF